VIRHLTLEHVLAIHADLIRRFGGDPGVLNPGMVQYCAGLTQMMFSGQQAYPTLIEKAAALGHALIANHCFADGNKRVGFGAADVFLRINGYKIAATLEVAEAAVLAAAGAGPAPRVATQDDLVAAMRQQKAKEQSRAAFTEWVRQHTVPLVAG
jgi:death-on-curing protein